MKSCLTLDKDEIILIGRRMFLPKLSKLNLLCNPLMGKREWGTFLIGRTSFSIPNFEPI